MRVLFDRQRPLKTSQFTYRGLHKLDLARHSPAVSNNPTDLQLSVLVFGQVMTDHRTSKLHPITRYKRVTQYHVNLDCIGFLVGSPALILPV